MFTMVSTRPNFAQAIVVSQFMVNPSKERNDDVKPILKYLWGTSNAAICYKLTNLQIEGFTDSDFGRDRWTKVYYKVYFLLLVEI